MAVRRLCGQVAGSPIEVSAHRVARIRAPEAGRAKWARFVAQPGRRREAIALVLSLACHSLLLFLNFGGDEFGLPGFAFPWKERRVEARDLRVSLEMPRVQEAAVPAARPAASPPRPTTIARPRAAVPAPKKASQ